MTNVRFLLFFSTIVYTITIVCGNIRWGSIFGIPTPSELVERSCSINDVPHCCELTNRSLGFYPNNLGFAKKIHYFNWPHHKTTCHMSKSYVPSEYERKHYEYGFNITHANKADKLEVMYNIIWEDIEHVPTWLARVKYHHLQHRTGQGAAHHMQHGRNGSTNTNEKMDADDVKYLSRMVFKTNCSNPVYNMEWYEWIEPLTIYGRHPFSLISCPEKVNQLFASDGYIEWGNKGKSKYVKGVRHFNSIFYPDYIISAGIDMAKQRVRFRNTFSHNDNFTSKSVKGDHSHGGVNANSHVHLPPRAFFFDAGTSLFDSSLTYFTCLYGQQGIPFDHIYGWEYTLLEPQNFWAHVPPPVKPHYTFMNIPVSENRDDNVRSLINFLLDTVQETDFVVLKLDIDTPEVENKIVSEILSDPSVSGLIDEFYFEQHYYCPFMEHCGWGNKMPSELSGLKLDIGNSLQMFRRLRELGIRAHMWI